MPPRAVDRLHGAIAAVAPHLPAEACAAWTAALAAPMLSSGITTPRRAAAFIGQIAVESNGFVALEENLNYSAARLCTVWPSHFDAEDAEKCAHQPERTADHVYCNRMGNGDVLSGDGWKYRGRGLVQITGKTNYVALAKADPRATDPDWLKTPEGAAISACWFWTQPHKPSLNVLADGWQITVISRTINGGDNGLQERIALSNVAFKWLS